MSEWSVSGFSEVRELGRGAQGRVVLARHATAGTPVAIKYLPADAAEADRALFEREARMLGQVRHPNVARLYRLVMGEQGAAIIMEAVDGVPLRRILAEHGALGPEASLLVLKGSLLGLAAAHRAGVVHRDYKPANVVVRGDGLSKLIDFGVAVWSGQGSRAGTPYYMAPEQWRGDPATPATDVYAATCVFYECVTGRRPYDPADRVALMGQHLTGPIPVAEAPEPLRPLVARGLAKDPAQRPPGAAAFVTELDAIAAEAYGADWEHRAVRALAAATAFAALFPLTAAGLAPAAPAPATAAAAPPGGESALQHGAAKGAAKTTSVKSLAAVSAAVVGVAAIGVAVYTLRDSDDPRGRPAAGSETSTSPRPSLSGVPLRVGDLTITAPATWKARAIKGSDGSTTDPRLIDTGHRVDVPGRCTGPKTVPFADRVYTDNCPGFAVLRSQWIDPGDSNVGYNPAGPFNPGTDIAAFCPRDPEKYSVAKPVSVQKQTQVSIGGRPAQYKEWRMECYGGLDGTQKSGVYFTQRLWYLAAQKLLVVDEFDTPNLSAILDQARWNR
ncbi:serine/threonine-protein kinase [Spirillospora sp. CA-255316]